MNRQRRARRVRAKVAGTASRPRLAVHISNRQVMAQIIDDEQGRTLVYSSSVGQKESGALSQKAAAVGTQIAQQAKKAKVKQVVLDRSHRQYHGRIAALAKAARKEGLEF